MGLSPPTDTLLLDQAVTFRERAQHPEAWLDSLREHLPRGLIDRIEIWQEGGDKWIRIVWREDRLADQDTS